MKFKVLLFSALISSCLSGSSALADTRWTASSQAPTATPIAFEAISSQVESAVVAYRKKDSDVGSVRSWTCDGLTTDSGSTLESCELVLDLPDSWCWYGSFEMTLKKDAQTGELVTTRYEWTARN